MNPYIDKFIATTKIYLQMFTGMTEPERAKGKEFITRHRALPSSILGGPFGYSQGLGASIQVTQHRQLL